MKCSVIIPTYNRSQLLRATLHSLTLQTLGPQEFEAIVVDDGSSDDSREVALSFSDRLNISYYFQEDMGYRVARARNIGIRHAAAPISVFIDSGVLLHSQCLQAHCDMHEQSDRPLAICGYVYGFNEDNEDAAEIQAKVDALDPDSTIARFRDSAIYLDLREEFYVKYTDEFWSLPAPWLIFWTCNASAPTEIIRTVGMFDEAFVTWGVEDVDLGYRLHRAGCKFVVCRNAASVHYPHEKSYERNMRSAAGNYRYFAEKYKTPFTSLVIGNHFFVINDMIRERSLPSCEEYLRGQGTQPETEVTPQTR